MLGRSPFVSLALACVLQACAIEPSAETDSSVSTIVNGEATGEFPTTGILLTGGNPATLVCSGTLIGCDRFLTAAHCVCSGTGGDCQNPVPDQVLRVYLQHGGFYSVSRRHVHPDYDFPDADVAVLELTRPADGLVPTPLAAEAVALDTQAIIAGYGRSGGSSQDYGIKQFGQVVTAECPPDADGPGHLCWDFEGQGSNTCNGDSGGPLFVDQGGSMVVAGITSGGTRGDCLAGDQSYDTDVFTFRQFIEEQAGGAQRLGQSVCGDLPRLGDVGTEIISEQDRVEVDGPLAVELEVPSGTAELRVTVNGTEGSDIDLYVQRGEAASETSYECAQDGASAYGLCAIDSPRPGTWHLLVTTDQSADVQLTATSFGSAPTAADDAYEVGEGEVLDVAAGVLQNDGEADRGPLSAEMASEPEHGVVELNDDGSFVYTPAIDFVGQDRFLYRATDGSYGAVAEVTIEVIPADQDVDGSDAGGCGCSGGGNGSSASALLFLLAWAMIRFGHGRNRVCKNSSR